ncbi:hypothetical protein V6N13_129131 [Hibiscus sabdariffa]|uniref:Uncharacterized protein n=1 Tax=Hibiscus sabdariffa TaxID=183260 RepID=A0ABR2SKI5_9ROSI
MLMESCPIASLVDLLLYISLLVSLLFCIYKRTMAKAFISRLVLLFITIVLMLVMVQPEARSYDHGKPIVAEKIDSMTMLEKLGYDLSKIEYYRRMLSGSPERISPGGPDPEHHV